MLKLPADRIKTSEHLSATTDLHESLSTACRLPDFRARDNANFLLACVAALLQRYTRQRQIGLRLHQALEGESEPCVLTLDVPSTLTLAELAQRVGAERTRKRSQSESANVGISLIGSAGRDAPVAFNDEDLHLIIQVADGQASVDARYDAALFDESTIQRMLRHLARFLALGDRMDVPVGSIDYLSDDETDALREMSRGPRRSRDTTPLLLKIAAFADAHPEATALMFGEASLSYAALQAKVEQVAVALAAHNVHGRPVAVCVEPSFDIIIALLAILKAGATYVPVDPAHPPQRTEVILGEIRPALVITQPHLADNLPFGSLATTSVTQLAEQSAAATGSWPQPEADAVAYVFYTSGTTGKPKGILATHANLQFYLSEACERYGISDRDHMLSVARYTFSISLFELLTPLFVGGRVELLPRESVLDISRLAEAMERATIFHIGPSLLRPLLAHLRDTAADVSRFDGIRHASSGGDMVTPEIIAGLQSSFRNAEVFVIYGCSEISCMGCTYEVLPGETVNRTLVGRPFPNVTASLRDDNLKPVPPGVTGEICFAGPGLVSGYLDRDALTAERFIELDGERFYRTGDMGRRGLDGNIEILGREDFQVQIRGMRIELGEIDATLKRAPGIRDGVVVAWDPPEGERTLVAFVVVDDEANIAAARRFLREWLPDYMLPADYIRLDRIPVNHNFKVDRSQLPVPDPASFSRGVSGATISDPVAAQVAEIAAEILGRERVDLRENFFDLGGDSLAAMQFILALEQALGEKVYWLDLIRDPLQNVAEACGAAKAAFSLPKTIDTRGAGRGFFFGDDDELYGLMHDGAPGPAAILCAPLGHEYIRARLILQRAARDLSLAGIDTLRFDYFAIGDSKGRDEEASLTRWRRDLAHAVHWMRDRRAPAGIVLVMMSSAALLLADQSPLTPDDKLVLVDPVANGARFVEQSLADEKTLRDSMVSLRRWRTWYRPRHWQDVLGYSYPRSLLSDLSAQVLQGESLPTDTTWQVLSHPERRLTMLPDRQTITYEHALSWTNLTETVGSIADTRVVDTLVQAVRSAANA